MKLATKIIFAISLLMIILGGLSDWTGEKYGLTKKQYWYGAIYTLIVAILLEISPLEW